MKRSEWSDKELIELLRQMPKIQDHRDPRDIYQNISLKKQKIKPWIVPSLAAAAALFLFFIIAPSLMGNSDISFDHANEDKSFGNSKVMKKTDYDSVISHKNSDSAVNESAVPTSDKVSIMKKNTNTKTAIYEDDVAEDGKVLTYWIPDPQDTVLIPVSIIVPAAKGKSWLKLFTENMANLKEEEWGLSDFYPSDLTMILDEKNNIITVDVPKDHQYGQGSTNEGTFKDVINKDISSNSNSKKVKLSTNGEPGIEFGNYGRKEGLNINDEKKHAFFFYYPEGSDEPFLTPSKKPYKDLDSAFKAMESDKPELGLKRSLLDFLPVNVATIRDKTLLISLKGNSNLEDNQLTAASFEAVLLTAKEFGLEKVVVKQAPLKQIGPFDLTKENKVPLAPNLRDIQ